MTILLRKLEREHGSTKTDPSRDGTCVRDYLHVLDLASGHLLALDALAPDSKVLDNCPDEARYKAYNLGKGRGMSVLQIVDAMRKATGFDYKYEIIGRRCVKTMLIPQRTKCHR